MIKPELLCFRCLCPGHMTFDCKLPQLKTFGLCAHCFLPAEAGDILWHPNGFARNCFFADVLKNFAVAAWHHQTATMRHLSFCSTLEEFWNWIHAPQERNPPYNNMVLVLLTVFKDLALLVID